MTGVTGMIDTRIIRIGLPPVLLIRLMLTRFDAGAVATLSLYIFSMGIHFSISVGD